MRASHLLNILLSFRRKESPVFGVIGNIKIPKNGKIKFPTLAGSMPINDNGLVSQNVVEEVSIHVKSGGTIHDKRTA